MMDAAPPAAAAGALPAAPEASVARVVVTARRLDPRIVLPPDLVGPRPVYRIGERLEAVAGLLVLAHSGEAKANQYVMRGENLDHGTDLALFVDGAPVNRPTNAHGQGYADLNFLPAPLVGQVTAGKGPFFADTGDFGGVGSIRIDLADRPPTAQVSAGTLGYADVFLGRRAVLASGRIDAAVDVGHVDGPFTHPDNFHRAALFARWTGAGEAPAHLTALYYKGEGRNTTDQPFRAIASGLITRFGSLDPTDGATSERASLTGALPVSAGGASGRIEAYAVASRMTLWNDFTHYLNDPVNGDQEAQSERRLSLGGEARATWTPDAPGAPELAAGAAVRTDSVEVIRRHTRDRIPLAYCDDGAGDYDTGLYACAKDHVRQTDAAVWTRLRATPWGGFAVELGARADVVDAVDANQLAPGLGGRRRAALLQPKIAVTHALGDGLRARLSIGEGFHSDDIRGVLGDAHAAGLTGSLPAAPLLDATWSEELAVEAAGDGAPTWGVSVFRQTYRSELVYDQDTGADVANAPSERIGIEAFARFRISALVSADLSGGATRARFVGTAADLAARYGVTGGRAIANAPDLIGAAGIETDPARRVSGGVRIRALGPYPLENGPAAPTGRGFVETGVFAAWRPARGPELRLDLLNALNTRAWASEFAYASAVTPAESRAAGPGGVFGRQGHPLEPRSIRLTLTFPG